MMPNCTKCGKPIAMTSRCTEWDGLPYHKNCLKEKYREDNPEITPEEYREFSKKVEEADKFKKDGNAVIAVKTPETEVQQR